MSLLSWLRTVSTSSRRVTKTPEGLDLLPLPALLEEIRKRQTSGIAGPVLLSLDSPAWVLPSASIDHPSVLSEGSLETLDLAQLLELLGVRAEWM